MDRFPNTQMPASQPLNTWSTEQAEGAPPLTYWIEAICEAFLDLKADSPERNQFHGRLEKHGLGAIDLNFIEASAQKVWRTQREIARSSDSEFYLICMRDRAMSVRQSHRETHIGPGDCVLLDSKEPLEFAFPDTFNVLSIQIPDRWLRQRIASPENATAIRFGTDTGWGATLASAAANLTRQSLEHIALPREDIAEHFVALMALATGERPPGTTTHQQDMIRRLMQSLRARSHETDLSPADIAAHHGISKRYLHMLFAAAGTSFSTSLINLRLGNAQHMLADPRFARLAIGEIAARCGFADPSHFARRFRRQFGAAPETFRRVRQA